MRMTFEKLEPWLSKFRISKKNMAAVSDIIKTQLCMYEKLNADISNITLYIVGKKIEGVDCIKVFDKNTVLIETLDTSYTRVQNLKSLEKWNANFLFKCGFSEGCIDIVKCNLSDVILFSFNLQKVRTLTYGVTDGEDAIKVTIVQQDIKGVECETLREMVNYAFNKRTGKNKSDLSYTALEYA